MLGCVVRYMSVIDTHSLILLYRWHSMTAEDSAETPPHSITNHGWINAVVVAVSCG